MLTVFDWAMSYVRQQVTTSVHFETERNVSYQTTLYVAKAMLFMDQERPFVGAVEVDDRDLVDNRPDKEVGLAIGRWIVDDMMLNADLLIAERFPVGQKRKFAQFTWERN